MSHDYHADDDRQIYPQTSGVDIGKHYITRTTFNLLPSGKMELLKCEWQEINNGDTLMPVSHDYHADDDTPLLILGCERIEYRQPSMTPYVLMLFGASLILLIASALTGPEPEPQELLGADRDMREVETETEQITHLQEGN